MDFDKLARKAQQVYTERGGAESAKGDAQEVEEILKGDGTFMDKAKRAAKALKEPGAAGDHVGPSQTEQAPEASGPPAGSPEAS